MEITKILVATIVGTTFMSAFSYAMSEAFNRLYKEPVLLNYVLQLSGLKISKYKSAVGWVLHYIVGLIFVLGLHLIWTRTSIQPSWISGTILGAITGIIGIIGWIIMFRLPTNPPKNVQYTEYYTQLFFAHIIFGLCAAAVYMSSL